MAKNLDFDLFIQEAQMALAREDWTTAINKLQAILDVEPTHPEAVATLNEAKRQQALATFYTRGRRHYSMGRLNEALQYFRQVQHLSGNYKDVNALIADIEQKIASKDRNQASRGVSFIPFSPWLWIGILAIPALLLFCIGAYFVRPLVITAPMPSPTLVPFVPSPTFTHTPVAATASVATLTPLPVVPTATFTPLPVNTSPSPLTLTPTPTATPTPMPTATITPIPTPVISFGPVSITIEAGACVLLQWQTQNVRTAFLTGGEFNNLDVTGASGARNVCPAANTIYTLRVLLPNGSEETRTSTITVIPRPTSTSTFTPTPTYTSSPTFSPTPPFTSTSTSTPTFTPMPTFTLVPDMPTAIHTFTPTPTYTPTPEAVVTPTGVLIPPGTP